MIFVGGTNFDSLKRDFSQIHNSTNEGIGSWCGRKEWVCSLRRGKYKIRDKTIGLQRRNLLNLVEINTSSSLTIFHQEKAISCLTIFSLKYYKR